MKFIWVYAFHSRLVSNILQAVSFRLWWNKLLHALEFTVEEGIKTDFLLFETITKAEKKLDSLYFLKFSQ